jgi:septal ring factor EnvC (AmiA/AmiB activator)
MVVALIAPVVGQAPDRSRAEAQARRAAERIRELHREADELATQERTLLGELRRLEIERQLKAEEVARLRAEVELATTELAATEARAAALAAAVEAQRPIIAARMVDLYKLGRAGYWRLLLGVEDVQSIGRAYRSVSALADLDRRRIEEHRRTLQSLAETRVALTRRARAARALQAEAQAARAALDRAVAARNARVAEIDERRDLNAQLTGELQDAQRKLQASLASLAAGRPASIALPLAPFRGVLPWPVAGRLQAPFGRRASSRFGTAIIRNGIEIVAAEGTPVRAVHEGRVAFAAPFTGFGNLVIVDHGADAYSLYGHLSSLAVRRGDSIDRQAPVGAVGLTPAAAAALYFELRIDGQPVDPVEWLKK